MKHITVTVEDALYRRARIRAAELDTTVTGLVRAYLVREAGTPSTFARLEQQQDAMLDEIMRTSRGFSAARRLARDQAHDRGALR